MPPKGTLWRREPHTEGKHLVLRRYLDAWFPIMSSWRGRILFIDGFAGPGEYAGGEEGSPLIAMRALVDHHARSRISAHVVFLFIEKDEKRAAHLDGLVKDWAPRLPPNAEVHVLPGAFHRSMGGVLDALEEQRKQMAPAFVMVDPFGVSETPMEVIHRVLENPSCEVYVSFIYEFINRFISTGEFQPHLDDLFGTQAWRDAMRLCDEERQAFLYALYEDQLRKGGANEVLHFDLFEGNRLVYSIFFGTQHPRGSDRMKQAIWKVAPFGDFSFRGSRTEQLLLGVDQPNFQPLRRAILEEFSGRGWVPVQAVLDFVASDATEYHSGQVKRPILKPLEEAGILEVDASSRQKKKTYPFGCRIRLKD